MVSGQSILNENFLAGQRLTQDLPDTSAWYGSAVGALSELPGGGVRVDATGTTRLMVTYFTDSGVVSVGTGEVLRATYQFQVINPQDSGTSLRIGLLNSGGSRIGDDGAGLSNGVFNAYSGYGAFYNPVTEATDAHSIRQRMRENSALLHVGTPWDNISGGGGDPISLAEGTLYTGIFSVSNTGTGLMISHQILSGDTLLSQVSHAVTENLVTGFDTFALVALGGAADRTDAIDLYSFTVAVGTAVLEPDWAGYPIRTDGWVDTGAFLGFVYPVGDFVYVWDLAKYIYLPEAFVASGGAWAFVLQ